MAATATITVLQDHREKAPFRFPTFDPHGQVVQTVSSHLVTGDYSLLDLTDRLAIERKKASELYQTVGSGRRRFRAELERLRAIAQHRDADGRPDGYACVIVEGSLGQVLGLGEADELGLTRRGAVTTGAGRRVTARQVLATVTAWSVEFQVPIWFAGELAVAERLAWEILTHRRWQR